MLELTRKQPPEPQQSVIQPPIQGETDEGVIKRKLWLLSPLLICLYMLTDTTYRNSDKDSNLQQRQHLAFITALSRHPPSLRVFRIVSESAFLLFCAAFALWVWEISSRKNDSSLDAEIISDSPSNSNKNQTIKTSIPSESVGKLLFSPPPNSITDNVAWMVFYKKQQQRVLLKRKFQDGRKITRRRGGGDEKSRRNHEENDLIELQSEEDVTLGDDDFASEQDVTTNIRGDEIEDNEGLSPLMMDTLSRNIRQNNAYELLNQDAYDENDNRKKFFESRNGTATREVATPSPKPPSSASVLGAALDITILTCMFLIFFTISSAEGGRYIDRKARGGIVISLDNQGENNEEISYMKFFAKIAAPLFPITLFILSILLVIFPWRKRKILWTIVSLTLGAPFYDVTFRDGFIGDILTSTVRPLQDLAYTVVFLLLGLQAWWDSQSYSTLTLADVPPIERSWFLHTFILPACTLSPLWWRFLQNLRQCFDTKHRWPYLGNALKYMLAAEVAIFGMFDPSLKNHPVWVCCFFVATLYQVWWDVFMDWGLLEWNDDVSYHYYYHSSIFSSSGSSRRKGLFWWPYKLRSRRAYPHVWMYHSIFIINFFLRFVGMLTLIPPVYLSRTTGLIVNTWYDPDFQLFVGSLAASAEIFRRTIWALLRLEWEVIKTSTSSSSCGSNERFVEKNGRGVSEEDGGGNDIRLEEEADMKPMAILSSSSSSTSGPYRRGGRLSKKSLESLLSDMSNLNDVQILSELCAWATIFSGIAIIAAAHREVL